MRTGLSLRRTAIAAGIAAVGLGIGTAPVMAATAYAPSISAPNPDESDLNAIYVSGTGFVPNATVIVQSVVSGYSPITTTFTANSAGAFSGYAGAYCFNSSTPDSIRARSGSRKVWSNTVRQWCIAIQ